jgi:plastocyanin
MKSEDRIMPNHAGGISIIAFVVALAVSMAYYQFVYLPEANAKPQIPQEVKEPKQTTAVTIVDGSANPSQTKNFDPKETRAVLGLSNKVVWTNKDLTAHTVTSDNGYKDPYSGVFDSLERPAEEGGGFVLPGKTYEFLFTNEGEFAYHCNPHPFMKGVVKVVPNFA